MPSSEDYRVTIRVSSERPFGAPNATPGFVDGSFDPARPHSEREARQSSRGGERHQNRSGLFRPAVSDGNAAFGRRRTFDDPTLRRGSQRIAAGSRAFLPSQRWRRTACLRISAPVRQTRPHAPRSHTTRCQHDSETPSSILFHLDAPPSPRRVRRLHRIFPVR